MTCPIDFKMNDDSPETISRIAFDSFLRLKIRSDDRADGAQDINPGQRPGYRRQL